MHGKPLIDLIPRGGRRPPEDLVRALREVRPDAELFYGGGGKWLLGTVRPNRVMRLKAQRRIGRLRQLLTRVGPHLDQKRTKAIISYRLWTYELQRQGFRPITSYRFQGEPTSWIMSDLQRRDWLYRHRFREELEARELEADQATAEEAALDRLLEYLDLEHRSIHHYAMRGRRSVGPRARSTRRH